jgi:hypothetical protein
VGCEADFVRPGRALMLSTSACFIWELRLDCQSLMVGMHVGTEIGRKRKKALSGQPQQACHPSRVLAVIFSIGPQTHPR